MYNDLTSKNDFKNLLNILFLLLLFVCFYVKFFMLHVLMHCKYIKEKNETMVEFLCGVLQRSTTYEQSNSKILCPPTRFFLRNKESSMSWILIHIH